MRGVAVLIAYLLGLGAIISFGIAGLMALQSPSKPTLSAPAVATAPSTERVAKPSKQTTQKDAQSKSEKRKTVNTTRKRREEAPTTSPSGLDAFGYANEHRRFYSPFFWGR